MEGKGTLRALMKNIGPAEGFTPSVNLLRSHGQEAFSFQGEDARKPNIRRSRIRSPWNNKPEELRESKRPNLNHPPLEEVQETIENHQRNTIEQYLHSLNSNLKGTNPDHHLQLEHESINFLERRKAKKMALDHQHLNTRGRPKIEIKASGDEEQPGGLQLVHLLLTCAAAIEENDRDVAENSLSQLSTQASATGNSIQRVVAYFAEGLTARMHNKSSPFYNSIVKDPSPDEKFAALIHFYRVSPYYQFAHFTANQAILEAFEGHHSLHVIDFNISYGFQWPSLIQSLSERDNPPFLRITGFGTDKKLLKETGSRLSNFARSCGMNMSFESRAFVEGSTREPIITADNLGVKQDEIVAVNLVFHLHRLAGTPEIYGCLNSIHALNPSIVTLVEHEASRNASTFLSRCTESLHYYAALFDSLDECLPCQSAERLKIEKIHFGAEMKSTITCEKSERTKMHERLETWKERMYKGGFRQIGLSSRSLCQAKLLLQIRRPFNSCEARGGFRVLERDGGRVLSLGWQDRILITASAWRCKIKSKRAKLTTDSKFDVI